MIRPLLLAAIALMAPGALLAQVRPPTDSLQRLDSLRLRRAACTESQLLMGTCRVARDTVYLDATVPARAMTGHRVDTVFVDEPAAVVDTVYVDRRTGRVVHRGPVQPVGPGTPGFKDGGTATLLSLLLVGGGHFYAGESGTGAALLLLSTASLGVALAGAADCTFECDSGMITAGLGGYTLLWLVGVFDAAPAAKRHNRRLAEQQSLRPVVGWNRGAARVGLSWGIP